MIESQKRRLKEAPRQKGACCPRISPFSVFEIPRYFTLCFLPFSTPSSYDPFFTDGVDCGLAKCRARVVGADTGRRDVSCELSHRKDTRGSQSFTSAQTLQLVENVTVPKCGVDKANQNCLRRRNVDTPP
jgi:hypothetical protein